MQQILKEISYIVLLFLISVALLIGMQQQEKRFNKKFEAVVIAFEEVEKGFQEQKKVIEKQNDLIEQYKRDCENITEKVINGEW